VKATRLILAGLVGLVLLLGTLGSNARAQVNYFTGAVNDDFNVAGNWSLGHVPAGGEWSPIDSGLTSTIYAGFPTVVPGNWLMVGAAPAWGNPGGDGTLNIDGSPLTTTFPADGTVYLAHGTATASPTGWLNVSNGGSLTAGATSGWWPGVQVGRDGGTGHLDVSNGGSVTSRTGITLGWAYNNGPAATGTMTISGAMSSVTAEKYWLIAGHDGGHGVVNQSDGVVNVPYTADSFYIAQSHTWFGGVFRGATGEYNMTGGQVNAGGDLYMSNWYAGDSTLDLSGDSRFGLGRHAYVNHSYSDYVGSKATINVSDTSSLTIGGHLYMSSGTTNAAHPGGDTATLTQTGGTVYVHGGLRMGETGGSSIVNLSGGTFEAGASGDWTHVGIGGPGQMTISGTADATFNSFLNVAYASPGTLTQTGGKVTVFRGLRVGEAAGGNGIVNLSGGTFEAGASGDWSHVGIGSPGQMTISGTADATFNSILNVSWVAPGVVTQTGGMVDAKNELRIGERHGSNGTYNLSGGTLDVAGLTRVGVWPTSLGKMTVSGSAQFNANGGLAIGGDGTGIFTQNGGQSDISYMAVSNSAGQGSANMNGGTMNIASHLMLSDSGWGRPATFNQTGGIVNVTEHTRVGHWPGGPSTYDLKGGTLNANGGLYVGWDGVGILNVNGPTAQVNASYISLRGNGSVMNVLQGTVQSTGNFFLGDQWGRSTTVNQSGGSVTINGETRVGHWGGETSTYTLSGTGSLVANGGFNVGWDGTGIFTQTGGTSAFNGGLAIRTTGTVELAGNGTSTASFIGMGYNGNGAMLRVKDTHNLTTNSLFLGEYNTAGTVEQSGGIVTVQNQLRLGHWGNQVNRYTLSGGELHLTGTPSGGGPEYDGILHVGVDGTGIFTQTGGDASAYGIILDNRSGTPGIDTFTLDGGTFTVGPWGISHGTWGGTYDYQINLGGGTLGASADWSSPLPMTLTGAVGDATVNTQNPVTSVGHTVTLSGVLSGPGGLVKDGDGTLIISGANTYAGTTTVDGGKLVLARGTWSPGSHAGSKLIINSGTEAEVTAAHPFGHWGRPVEIDDGTFRLTRELYVNGITMTGGVIEGPFDARNWLGVTANLSGDTATINARLNLLNGIETFNVADGAQDVDLHVSAGIGDVSWWGGTAGLRKTGDGTMLLEGNSSLGDMTHVDQGTLLVNGSLSGDVTVNLNGTISAGSSPGHMIITDSSSYTQTGTMLVELGGLVQGTEYDWIEVDGGAADVAGLLDILLVGSFQPASGATFDVLTATDGVTDSEITLDWNPAQLLPAQYWTYSIVDLPPGGQALRLELGVPEPSTLVLAALGLLGLCLAGWRKRK